MTSASSKIMNGAFPPSSSEIFFIVPAACFIRSLPTLVYIRWSIERDTDPVKEILRTSGFSQSSDPTSFVFAWAVTMLITPFGTPARSASSASARAVYGVSDAGLITQVHPAAIAAPTFLVIIATISQHPPGSCTHWKIPRCNNSNNTNRLSNGNDPIPLDRTWDYISIHPWRFLTKPFKETTSISDFALGLRQRFSVLPSKNFGNIVRVLLTEFVPFS